MKPQERSAAIFGSGLSYTQKIVLLALCSFMSDGRDSAWPAVATLQSMTSLGERSVQRVLKAGIAGGWLREDLAAGRRTRTFSVVWSALPTPVTESPRHRVTPSQSHPVRKSPNPVTETGYPAPETANPVTESPEPYRTDQEPTKEPETPQTPQGALPGLLPKPEGESKAKKLSKADREAQEGLDRLRRVRADLHTEATGKPTRGVWAQGKVGAKLARQVRAYLAELRDAELGEPLDVLETVARWVYLGPDDFFRRRPDPLGSMLGGNPTTRNARAQAALDWADRGVAGSQATVLQLVERVPAAKASNSSMTAFLKEVPEPVQRQFKDAVKQVTGLEAWQGWSALGTGRELQFAVNNLRKAVGGHRG